MTADVTQPVTLSLAGKVTDNSDVLARCEQIIRCAQISNFEKVKLMESLSNSDRPLKSRIASLRSFGSVLTYPLSEQLTLTEDPFMDAPFYHHYSYV